MKVSVILCGYNQAKYVEKAIQSVLTQTYPHIELLVVDNGSQDGSPEILKHFREDPRVRLFLYRKNGPVTQRLNLAIQRATGEYIAILYADDYYLPRFLEKSIECFENASRKVGVVYSPGYRENIVTKERWIGTTMKASGDVLREMLLTYESGGHINPISPVVKRECYLRYPFHEELFQEAEAIYLRLAMRYRFRYLDEPLVVMREHMDNLGKAIRRNYDCFFYCVDKMESSPEFPKELRSVLRLFKSRAWRSQGWMGFRMGEESPRVRHCLGMAVKERPWQVFHPKVFGGFGLTWLPKGVRQEVNALANRVRRPKENVRIRQGAY